MKQQLFTILGNTALAADIFRLTLEGKDALACEPGQFVDIRLKDRYLRRPISVCNVEGRRLTLVYKVVGHGTEELSRMKAGETLDLLTGLGHGYDLSAAGSLPLLIGGGVGIPPLYYLARRLREKGLAVQAVLGFNSAADVFFADAFRELGCLVTITTLDGSRGIKGFVTDALPAQYSHYYTCGPMPMLKAVYAKAKGDGEFSFEERMGCGFGACMGCSCKTKDGYKRICKDGPVLKKEEILWED